MVTKIGEHQKNMSEREDYRISVEYLKVRTASPCVDAFIGTIQKWKGQRAQENYLRFGSDQVYATISHFLTFFISSETQQLHRKEYCSIS